MRCSRLMLVVSILLSCSAVVLAQGGPGGPPPGGGRPGFNRGPLGPPPLIMLASQKAIQEELKLNQDQKEKIAALDSKMRELMGERMPPQQDPSNADAMPEPPGKEMEKDLAEILSEKQLIRLKQVALQIQGLRALLAKDLAEELELTEKQLEKIRKLTGRNAKGVQTVLTKEQQAKWQEMTGPVFRGKLEFGPPGMSPPNRDR